MNIENAENILKEFITPMNHWELHCDPIMKIGSSDEEDLLMTNELNVIFDKFYTKRERKYDQQAGLSCGNPPEVFTE